MKILSLICIISAGLAWGTACLFVHALSAYGFDSIDAAAARCIAAALVLTIYLIIKYKKMPKINCKQFVISGFEGMAFFAMAVTYFYTMKETSASTAAMLISSAPIIVTTFSVIFWGEKMTLKKLIAILLSLIGCGLVVGIVSEFEFSTYGLFIGILSAIFYAVYSICTKLLMRSGMNPDVNITYSFLFSAAAAVIFANPLQIAAQISVSPIICIALISGIGIVTGAFAGLMYTYGMKPLPAGLASSLAVIEPLTSTVLSVIFLNETLAPSAVVGILFVITAVIMLSFE